MWYDSILVKVIQRNKYMWAKRVAGMAAVLTALAVAFLAVQVRPLEQNNGSVAAEDPTGPPRTTLYLPTWLEPDQYKRIAALPLSERRVDVVIAFVEPTSDGRVRDITLPPGLLAVVAGLDEDARVSVAIGGWGGNDAIRQQILSGFRAASLDPAKFADDVAGMANNAGQKLGRPVTGIDIDWEYPERSQAAGLSGLIAAVRSKLPGVTISLAVPADANTEGFAEALPSLSRNADRLHVMTYDQTTPYDGIGASSGPVASTGWVVDTYRAWQGRAAKAGGSLEVVVGFPAYCYSYEGAKASGDRYADGYETPWNEVELTNIQPQADGSSAITSPSAWRSCYTPTDVRRTRSILAENNQQAATFVWSAEGLTSDYLAAISE